MDTWFVDNSKALKIGDYCVRKRGGAVRMLVVDVEMDNPTRGLVVVAYIVAMSRFGRRRAIEEVLARSLLSRLVKVDQP